MTSLPPSLESSTPVQTLSRFIQASRHLFVLTGAGCSTDSGIPEYRNRDGSWKQKPPVQFHRFTTRHSTRQRYWSRSMIGWRRVANAQPSSAHDALARLEHEDRIHLLVTQNVDRLHQRAGSERVVDLHGRIDRVRCLGCDERSPRRTLQQRLETLNPGWASLPAEVGPDGDAKLSGFDLRNFVVPDCDACGGILKPDVVFFGENVPTHRVDSAFAALTEADALLIIGSSLMVWSGFRFAKRASERAIPIAAVNDGTTRADELLDFKIERRCGDVLRAVAEQVVGRG